MNLASLVARGFQHYWKSHIGLLFGAFLASAILSGSLVVGDSVRASLRRAGEVRLGKIQSGILGGDRWFTQELARKSDAAPMIIATGSVSSATGNNRANAVQVLGVDDAFWKLSPSGKTPAIGKDTLAINDALARRLGVKIGDTVLVRLEKPSAISRDAPLSGEANQDVTLRRTIAAIIEPEDFGAFQLTAAQTAPLTVFVPLADMAETLEKKERANAMVRASRETELNSEIALEDVALKLQRVKGSAAEWEISTDRIFMDDAIADKLRKAIPQSYDVLTYMVNGFSSAKGRTPYSFVTAFSGHQTVKPSQNTISISQWLAEDLSVAVGDSISVRYFTVGLGREMKEQTASFTVGTVLPMSDPQLNPTWTPDFPGVSDAKNCRDWQPGIPMKLDTIRDKDEAYWKQYKATPKAFISLADGQRLWGNRFGKFTAIRFADTGQNEAALRHDLVSHLRLSDVGLVPRNFRAEAKSAAQGSVDFGGLFVGLSLFLITAALVFSALLFLFTLEQRASQIGLMLALGLTIKQVRRIVLLEAGAVAVLGAVLGLLGGAAYTRLALAGLNGVWSGATVGLRLVYEANAMTFGIAFASSVFASIGTLWWASRRIFQAKTQDLLAGEAWTVRQIEVQRKRLFFIRRIRGLNPTVFSVVCLMLAIVFSVIGSKATNPEEIAGMFFGAGFMLLAAGLILIRKLLSSPPSAELKNSTSLCKIGLRNITRRPGRSLSVIGMMAGGIFLVIAVNAFRLGAESDPTRRDSGTGGFALIGESTLPIYEDLNSEAGREAFALDDKIMKNVHVVPFRVRDGDDASCLNLNKAQRPQLVALNIYKLWPSPQDDTEEDFYKNGPFSFVEGCWYDLVGIRWTIPSDRRSKFADPRGHEITAIADQATAMWGLGKGVGDTITYTDAQGREFNVKLVGLLAGSVLQGKVIIDEAAFLEKYPDAAGYKFFLVDAAPDKADAVRAHLTRQFEQRGLALESTTDRLAAFSEVQNTYIGIFTVLGGLGVLLGTAGLGVLALRNVLERRGEFGLMQALGFRAGALRSMVLVEHAALLVGGLILGLVSAAIAVWPNVRQSGGVLPFEFLFWLNVSIFSFGIAVCWLAARLALRGRLLDAVRRE